MPKMPKSKIHQKTFRLNLVKKNMNTWKSKAEELETVAKKCYKNIRSYIPRHEFSMTVGEKQKLVDLLSESFTLAMITIFLSYRSRSY